MIEYILEVSTDIILSLNLITGGAFS